MNEYAYPFSTLHSLVKGSKMQNERQNLTHIMYSEPYFSSLFQEPFYFYLHTDIQSELLQNTPP